MSVSMSFEPPIRTRKRALPDEPPMPAESRILSAIAAYGFVGTRSILGDRAVASSGGVYPKGLSGAKSCSIHRRQVPPPATTGSREIHS